MIIVILFFYPHGPTFKVSKAAFLCFVRNAKRWNLFGFVDNAVYSEIDQFIQNADHTADLITDRATSLFSNKEGGDIEETLRELAAVAAQKSIKVS